MPQRGAEAALADRSRVPSLRAAPMTPHPIGSRNPGSAAARVAAILSVSRASCNAGYPFRRAQQTLQGESNGEEVP